MYILHEYRNNLGYPQNGIDTVTSPNNYDTMIIHTLGNISINIFKTTFFARNIKVVTTVSLIVHAMLAIAILFVYWAIKELKYNVKQILHPHQYI